MSSLFNQFCSFFSTPTTTPTTTTPTTTTPTTSTITTPTIDYGTHKSRNNSKIKF